jgi:hypothetical protein
MGIGPGHLGRDIKITAVWKHDEYPDLLLGRKWTLTENEGPLWANISCLSYQGTAVCEYNDRPARFAPRVFSRFFPLQCIQSYTSIDAALKSHPGARASLNSYKLAENLLFQDLQTS